MTSRTPFTIASVNVNGIRAAARRDMGAWLRTTRPDILLLQETRAPAEIVSDILTEDLRDIWGQDWDPTAGLAQDICRIKGRAGVAIFSRLPVQAVRTGVAGPEEEPDVDSGRWVEADIELPGLGEATFVSLYAHSGTINTPKQEAKDAHMLRLDEVFAALADSGRPAWVAGDFNVVRSEKDIKNWKGNHNKTSGVLDHEIAHLERWFAPGAMYDLARHLDPDAQGPYTWWSWRGKAFDNDAGWRIDYHAVTEHFLPMATSTSVDRAPAYDQRFSDHAPLIAHLDLGQ